jgi:chemotaxis response regulator CheB
MLKRVAPEVSPRAQDESTSVIYGMPREAVLMDAAQMVLP